METKNTNKAALLLYFRANYISSYKTKMFRGENSHSLSYEQQAKFIQDRITNVEKNFGDLCVAFGDYARKTARL